MRWSGYEIGKGFGTRLSRDAGRGLRGHRALDAGRGLVRAAGDASPEERVSGALDVHRTRETARTRESH